MTRTPISAAMLLTVSAALAGQSPRFEMTQKDLFAAGGSFVNAWADYDSDGDLDLFVGFDGTPNRLYRNDSGRFADAAAAAGVADTRPTRAAAWGDADGDGDADLLVGFTVAKDSASILKFYRNSKGVFSDHTNDVGLSLTDGAVRQPAWVDFDGDDDLDLFVAFRDRANAMFRNDAGRFLEVAQRVGLADQRRTVGAVWFDYDEDGDLDVIVGNMDGDANGLYSQQNGKFTDVAATAGVAWGGRTPNDKSNGTVRPCVADVNGDGRLDLFFANYGKNGLFLNQRKGGFEDASAAWGIDIDARYDSCALADMDNDGDLDLCVNGTVTGGKQYPDYLFRNTGTRFEDVTPAEMLPAQQAERVVPVHQEPRHHLVFDSPGTRILDVQIPPGDTTLFHTHSDPILYVTMSTSRTRSQNIGEDWPAPAAGAPPAPGAPSAPSAPGAPGSGRMMSTTSYAERPQTHRVNNIGSTLFRLIGITNSSAGDDRSDPSGGFDIEPELSNRWFRGYRRALPAEDSPEHRHENPVAIVLVSGSVTVRTAATTSNQQLLQRPGAFVFLDAGATHVLRADVPDTQVVEVEVRRPRRHDNGLLDFQEHSLSNGGAIQ